MENEIGLSKALRRLKREYYKPLKRLIHEKEELVKWLVDILELAQTKLPPPGSMTEEQWANHRLNSIARIAKIAIQQVRR